MRLRRLVNCQKRVTLAAREAQRVQSTDENIATSSGTSEGRRRTPGLVVRFGRMQRLPQVRADLLCGPFREPEDLAELHSEEGFRGAVSALRLSGGPFEAGLAHGDVPPMSEGFPVLVVSASGCSRRPSRISMALRRVS